MDDINDWFSSVRATPLSYGVENDGGRAGPTEDDAGTASRSFCVGSDENCEAAWSGGACTPSSSTEARLFYSIMDTSACIFLNMCCITAAWNEPAFRQQQGNIDTGHTGGGPGGGLYVARPKVSSLPNEGVGRKGDWTGGSWPAGAWG